MKLWFAALAFSFCGASLGKPNIVGFDLARGGQFSINEGAALTELRAAILHAFPNATFRGISTLTAEGLAGADVVILSSAKGPTSAITPLTAPDETSALRNFRDAGYGAIIFADNDSFAGAEGLTANYMLTLPYGISATGTGPAWERAAIVTDPHSSPVTEGPFGSVRHFSVGWSGWFVGGPEILPTLATLADNAMPVLRVWPRGWGESSSSYPQPNGAAVLFADSTMINDGYLTPENKAIVLNALAYVAGPGCPGDLNSDAMVDDADFQIFVAGYNVLDCMDPSMTVDCPADFDADGFVDDTDFVVFVLAYNELICP